MCRPKAEGGQRCAAHTGAALQKAETAYLGAYHAAMDAKRAGSPEFPALQLAALDKYAALNDARADFASTEGGAQELRTALAQEPPGSPAARLLTRALEDGAHRRERNAAIRLLEQAPARTLSDGLRALNPDDFTGRDADRVRMFHAYAKRADSLNNGDLGDIQDAIDHMTPDSQARVRGLAAAVKAEHDRRTAAGQERPQTRAEMRQNSHR